MSVARTQIVYEDLVSKSKLAVVFRMPPASIVNEPLVGDQWEANKMRNRATKLRMPSVRPKKARPLPCRRLPLCNI